MISRVLAAGLLAGLVAGLAVAALQHVTTTPLILAAETYEAAQHAAQHAPSGDAPEAAGFVGGSRTLATSVATIAAASGYALVLLAAMLFAGETIQPKRAAIWGACGFAATGLATSLGLAPQLPGAAETDLIGRQIWWVTTAAATASGLYALLRAEAPVWKVAGLLLILAPHLIGAPQPATPESTVPAEIAARFAAASLTAQAATWVLAGALVGFFWRMLHPGGGERR